VPQVKLHQVGFKALHDEAFFKALLEKRDNPEQVLEPLGWTLSPGDLDKLKRSLREPATVTFDLSKFLTLVHERGVRFGDGDGDWTLFCGDWFDIKPGR
jgi:hypothetical protein